MVNPRPGRLREGELRYASGMFGTSLPINMLVAYMAYYYVDRLSVVRSVELAGIFVWYAIIDALDNPTYGYLSDRTRTRWGRRRPWLVLGAPLLAVGLIAFFSPPEGLSPGGYVAWFAIFAMLTQTADSLVNANYGALMPELFPEEGRRARVNAYRQGLQLFGLVVSVALTPVITDLIGFSATATAYGIAAAAIILNTAVGARENPARQADRPPRAIESVRGILGQRPFWLIALANGAYAGGMALVLAGAPFFVEHVLQLEQSYTSVLFASVILASVGFLAVWARAVQRRGALLVWRRALLVLAFSFAPMYFVETLPAAIAAGLLIGAGYSGVMASVDVVIARFIDADAAHSGLHREAMVISAFGFFNRLNALAKSFAFWAIFVIFGYVSGDEPGPRADDAARFLMLGVPALLISAAAFLSRFVRIDAAAPAQEAGAGIVRAPRASGTP